ncbi:hypothetical protein D9619_009816 [Psilocybe cf. subviscida]|uniref:Uncharacterized protein n=1 Tax=Psilocybe cf. subviscida TaxID=2480587 RepID=A0A8H5BLH0_9AGAR|nr:hypothetical protein D9619_009816 [Psilocybe cf. subviscida]
MDLLPLTWPLLAQGADPPPVDANKPSGANLECATLPMCSSFFRASPEADEWTAAEVKVVWKRTWQLPLDGVDTTARRTPM